MVVAALVVVVDQVLKAWNYEVSKALSVFIGLIITNCIIMGRLEGLRTQQPPLAGIPRRNRQRNRIRPYPGDSGILPRTVRKRNANGIPDIPQSWYDAGYMNNGLMILPPMAPHSGGLHHLGAPKLQQGPSGITAKDYMKWRI